MVKLLLGLLALSVSVVSAQATTQPAQPATAPATTPATGEATLWQALVQNPDFTMFVSLLEQSGLAEELQGPGEYTVLAPPNSAFDNLGQTNLTRLGEDQELLSGALNLHVLQGRYHIIDLHDAAGTLTAADGSPLDIEMTAGGLTVNGVGFAATNVDNDYSNGVLHAVNDVILPVGVRDEFARAREADMAAAPATTAPATAPATPAVPATPAAPATTETTTVEATAPAMADMTDRTILGFLQNDGRFTQLLEAINQAGLAETLDSPGSYTLFAPTDAAFDNLTDVERQQMADPAALGQLLQYHVVEGELTQDQLVAEGATEGDPRLTLQGTDLRLTRAQDGRVTLNDTISVEEADIRVSNGVVHVIDRVLAPMTP